MPLPPLSHKIAVCLLCYQRWFCSSRVAVPACFATETMPSIAYFLGWRDELYCPHLQQAAISKQHRPTSYAPHTCTRHRVGFILLCVVVEAGGSETQVACHCAPADCVLACVAPGDLERPAKGQNVGIRASKVSISLRSRVFIMLMRNAVKGAQCMHAAMVSMWPYISIHLHRVASI